MDQLKVILKQLQKYHFWLLSVVAIIAGIAGTMLAARSLSAAYTEGKGKIVAKFKSLGDIRSTDPHPNSQWKQAVEKLNGQEQTRVRKAWDMVYDEQKALLVWPTELKETFLNFIANNPPSAEIPRELRERYRDYIKNEFPRLLKIIDAPPLGDPKATAASPSTKDAGEPAHEYRVVWDTSNEGEIRKTLDWGDVPSSAEVRRAQEDLWVYAALLTIIKNVNDEHQFTTPVREIGKVEIGKPAAVAFEGEQSSSHIIHLAAAADAAAPPAAGHGGPPEEAGAEKAADEGRYVDENGKQLGPGLTQNAEFKRMPVFLRLKIDQREILRFLVECANSPLPVEVRQLRINPSKGSANASPTGVPKGAGSESASYDVPLELHGIIYIYNKPNMAKLGGANAPGGPIPPGSAPPAAPAQPPG